MNKKKNDLLNLARREKYFSTLAKKEAKGAEIRSKKELRKGYTESAKDSKWEAKISHEFANIRRKKSESARRKAERSSRSKRP
jgi:hypothetical protein